MTYNIYEYTPSLRAAFVFAVAFSLTAIALIFTSIRDWTWHFTPIILRLILESSKFCQFGTRRWYDQVETAGYIAWGISLGYTSYCSNTLCSGCPSFDSSFDLYAFRSSHCRLSPSLKSRCPSFNHLGWQKRIRYWRFSLLHCSMCRRWHNFKHEPFISREDNYSHRSRTAADVLGLFKVTRAILHVRMNKRSTMSMAISDKREKHIEWEYLIWVQYFVCFVIYQIYWSPLGSFL